MNDDLIWNGRESDDFCAAKLRYAKRESEYAIARLQGMKVRAASNPPTQIDVNQRFPYPARTCAQLNIKDMRDSAGDGK